MAGNGGRGGASRSGGGVGIKVAKRAVSAPVSASSVDRFRAASQAARERNTRATFRAFDRGVAQGRAAGVGYQGTYVGQRTAKGLTKKQLADPGFRQGLNAGTVQFSANRTPRQQRSVDVTNRATRFYGLGTVTRGKKASEFSGRRGSRGYRAPATRLF